MRVLLFLLIALAFCSHESFTTENVTQSYEGPALPIPDNGDETEEYYGVDLTFTFPASTGPVKEIYFEMYIKHPY